MACEHSRGDVAWTDAVCDLCAQRLKDAKPGQLVALCPGCSEASRKWMGGVKRVVGKPTPEHP